MFDYKYDVLEESGNRKYARREQRRGLQVIGPKITNNSDETITLVENVKIYADNQLAIPIEPQYIQNQLKQPVPIYLLYILLWLTFGSCENNDCNTTAIPIGLPISIGNMAVDGTANAKFLDELKSNNFLSKQIKPGEKAYGLVGFKSTGYSPLSFKVN